MAHSDLNAEHVCTFCSLPLPPSWKQAESGEAAYCCVGCRIASQITGANGDAAQPQWMIAKLGAAIFFSMLVMVFTMALWSQDFYEVSETEFSRLFWGAFRYLGLFFSTPVLFLLGGPIFETALAGIRRRQITTELLICFGVAAAYLFSAWSVLRGEGHVYFEVACMILILVTFGKWLEAHGKLRTSKTLDDLSKLLPEKIRVIREGIVSIVSRAEVVIGDRIRVLPGERFAVDGILKQGTADVDQQLITGESEPVFKSVGSVISSGTLNLDGDLQIEVTRSAGDETVSRMIELIHSARMKKSRYERMADRLAEWFVPVVCVIAISVGIYYGVTEGYNEGILVGLSVILIACPCALGLATPMALWTALGVAARHQVLFQSGEDLERLASLKSLCFDKTGTLTTGHATVKDLFLAPDTDRQTLLRIASRLASGSNHVFSAAIKSYADPLFLNSNKEEKQTGEENLLSARSIRLLPGYGLAEEEAAGRLIFLGNERLIRRESLKVPAELAVVIAEVKGAGQSFSCVAWEGRVQGVFVFSESLRENAEISLKNLAALGLDLAVITGDHQQRAELLSKQLHVRVEAELLPAEKVATIQATKKTYGSVGMVGDGLNDAPALAAADTGIAMGCGADLSRESAAVCLLSNDLTRIDWSIQLARQTVRTIRQNLFWASAYNVIGIWLAATGQLNPILSAIAMTLSSGMVVGNSLRLNQFNVGGEVVDRSLQAGLNNSLSKNPINKNQAEAKPASRINPVQQKYGKATAQASSKDSSSKTSV